MSLDLWFYDFNGSIYEEFNLNGKYLLDPGFFYPNSKWMSTPAIDLFSIGSIFYIIFTGYWLYRGPRPFKMTEEIEAYDQHIEKLFKQGKFPDIEGFFRKRIILYCWTPKYINIDDVL